MAFKKILKLSLITIITDIILFAIGAFLYAGFRRFCDCVVDIPCECSQPFSHYFGIFLMVLSLVHFFINLIIFIIIKFKK